MATNAFKKQLAASKETWKAAQKKVIENRGNTGAPEFDDGIYLMKLASAELGEWNGKLKVLFKWKFVDGDYKGQLFHDYQGIGSEENLYYFGRRLEQFGYEMPDDPTEIQDTLTAIVAEKKFCKVKIRTKGEWQNAYLNVILDDDDEEIDGITDEDQADDADAEEPAEEKPAKKKGKAKAEPVEEEAADEEEEEDEAEEEEEEEEEETEDGDDPELEVGMAVIAETAKGEQKGEVIEVLAKEGKARVKLADGRTVKLDIAKLTFDEAPEDEEDEEEEEEAPAPPPAKKKAAPAPAPAKTKKR